MRYIHINTSGFLNLEILQDPWTWPPKKTWRYCGWAVAKSDKPPILDAEETQRKLVYKHH